jgi:hypothetical protein
VGEELGPRGGGDHGGVVSGQSQRREGDGEAAAVGFGLKAAAELTVGGDSAGDDDAVGAEGFGCGEGLALEVADYGVLEGGDEVEGLLIAEICDGGRFGSDGGVGGERGAAGLDARAEMVGFDVAEDCGLDAAEGEVEVRALAAGWGLLVCGNTAVAVDARLDLAEGEGDGAGVAIGGEGVDPGAAGVAEAEELGDLVVGLAGGVIDGAAYVAVGPDVCGRRRLPVRGWGVPWGFRCAGAPPSGRRGCGLRGG